jgi:hypothetical protein
MIMEFEQTVAQINNLKGLIIVAENSLTDIKSRYELYWSQL